MEAAKCQINGSDFIGAFATSTDNYTFVAWNMKERIADLFRSTLKTKCVSMSVSGTDLVGLFCKANSRALALSNMVTDVELERIRSLGLDMEVETIDSNINAIGNNILVNDKLAIVNPDYSDDEAKRIGELFDVEVVRMRIGGFKTVGANSILTNRGLAVNNHCTEEEKADLDGVAGFDSVMTTANTGALSIGLAAVSNSNGVVVGDGTTGYEFNRIIEALDAG